MKSKFLSYELFLESHYPDSNSYVGAFFDMHDSEILKLERDFFKKKFSDKSKEQIDKEIDTFWETLKIYPELEDKFYESFIDLFDAKWKEMYVQGFDKQRDADIMTPLFKEIVKKVRERGMSKPGTTHTPHTLRNSFKEREKEEKKLLGARIFQEHPEDFEKIYKEAVDALYRKRGMTTGKKFGI